MVSGYAIERLIGISGTVSPIDKRSSLVGNPPAVYGTNAESCQHLYCGTWRVLPEGM